jgi:hypothetical protein
MVIRLVPVSDQIDLPEFNDIFCTILGCGVNLYYSIPGKPVAAPGAAEGNRIVVVDQPVAAVGEGGRATGQACAVQLADASGKTPDVSTACGDVAQDRNVPRHELHHLHKQHLAHVHAALPVVESRKHRK